MDIIKQALSVMESEFREGTTKLNNSNSVKDFCRLQIGNLKDEVFAAIFMDNHLKHLGFKIFFYGTVSECNIHFRPMAREALELNAAKIILTHNHPSGNVSPSNADIHLTSEFKEFFRKLDCQVVDHVIVSPTDAISLTEEGFI